MLSHIYKNMRFMSFYGMAFYVYTMLGASASVDVVSIRVNNPYLPCHTATQRVNNPYPPCLTAAQLKEIQDHFEAVYPKDQLAEHEPIVVQLAEEEPTVATIEAAVHVVQENTVIMLQTADHIHQEVKQPLIVLHYKRINKKKWGGIRSGSNPSRSSGLDHSCLPLVMNQSRDGQAYRTQQSLQRIDGIVATMNTLVMQMIDMIQKNRTLLTSERFEHMLQEMQVFEQNVNTLKVHGAVANMISFIALQQNLLILKAEINNVRLR